MTRHILKRVDGELVDVTHDTTGVIPHGNDGPTVTKKGPKKRPRVIDGSQSLGPQLEEPEDQPEDSPPEKPGLTDKQRDAIYAEIDGLSVDKAKKAMEKVTDLTLLDRIRDNARYVTTRHNADARIAALKEA